MERNGGVTQYKVRQINKDMIEKQLKERHWKGSWRDKRV